MGCLTKTSRPCPNCTCIISATTIRDERSIQSGVSTARGLATAQTDSTPELATKPDGDTIVIYVGSILHRALRRKMTSDEIAAEVNATTAHELTHYAQRGTVPLEAAPTRREKAKDLLVTAALRAAISSIYVASGILSDSRWAKTGATTAISTEMMSFGSPAKDLAAGLIVAAITHASGTRSRRRARRAKQLNETHEDYLEHPDEIEARSHENTPIKLVSLTLRQDIKMDELESIAIPFSSKNRIKCLKANRTHRKLALQPRL